MDRIQITATIDAAKTVKPFRHWYRAFGYANADYTYTPATRRMYDYLSSYAGHGLYMRLHNILTLHGEGDRYFLEGFDYGNPRDERAPVDRVFRLDESRELVCNWEFVDRVYDIMLYHGMRPIVETHRMPHIAKVPVERPAKDALVGDYALWGRCVRAFTEHVVERYGLEEVRQWYFEVWNEPDGTRAFREDPARFLALYDHMEAAVHGVDEQLRVGGPATMQNEYAFELFRRFLEHCTAGVNYVTGQVGTRVDFLSVHCKGGVPNNYCPSTEAMFDSLRRYLEILAEYPQMKDVEFFNDESDVVWAGNLGVARESWLNFRSTHYFAGFVCKMVDTYCQVVEDEHGVNLAVVDSDNCHQQWERSLFSGNRSQLTPLVEYPSTDLLRKPIFNAYVLLSRMSDQRLAVSCDADGFGRKFGILPTRAGDRLAVMVWNFEDGTDESVNARRITVRLENLPVSGSYRLVHYRIDGQHSNAYAAWAEQGKPAQPGAEQVAAIRSREQLALAEPVQAVQLDGDWDCAVDLPMHAVSLLLLVPESDTAPAGPEWNKHEVETGYAGNRQVFLKWTPAGEDDFLRYELQRKSDGDFQAVAPEAFLSSAAFVDMAPQPGENIYRVRAVSASAIAGPWSQELHVAVQ
ncbi:MAG: GH39 family glycosyl hydrolase [Planctomycetota bacterium]